VSDDPLSELWTVVCFVVTSWAIRSVAAANVANASRKVRHFIGVLLLRAEFRRIGGDTAPGNDHPHHARDRAAAGKSSAAVVFVFLLTAARADARFSKPAATKAAIV
jgi:hypothetical protein